MPSIALRCPNTRLNFALRPASIRLTATPRPSVAGTSRFGIVFVQNRPTLNIVTPVTVDSTLGNALQAEIADIQSVVDVPVLKAQKQKLSATPDGTGHIKDT